MRMKDADWDDVLNTNLKGAFNMTRAVSRPMMKKHAGRIINIGSVVGSSGNPGQANYAASKAGLIGLSKAVARELASRNILVNVIAPGYIVTEMTGVLGEDVKNAILAGIPLGKFGAVRDISNAAVFLASDAAGYITGQVLHVNGGLYM
jgi:3-oxoacyl-[acyl-carrier protein] reductase